MGARQSDMLVCSPFPALTWDGSSWTFSDNLPAWAEFQGGMGSDFVDLEIATDDEDRSPPTPEQVAAYEFLKANDSSIAENIVARICREYPATRARFEGVCESGELAEVMPKIQSPEDLKPLIGLVKVYIHRDSGAGVAYLGFELECTWDEEHGLGVMVHKDFIVAYGDADTALDA